MKKVLLVSVAILLAGLTQAASIAWGSRDPLAKVEASPSGGTLSNYVAYLCVGDASVASETLSSIQAGTWEASPFSKNLNAQGIISAGSPTLLGAEFSAGTEYSFFIVIFDEADEHVLISSVLSGTPYDEAGTDPMSSVKWDAAGLNDNGWQTIASVPEPTVLALLALGVAGLALKRRVA